MQKFVYFLILNQMAFALVRVPTNLLRNQSSKHLPNTF